MEAPELNKMINPHWSHYLRVTGLTGLLMGWWLYCFPRHVVPLLIAAACGLVVGLLYQGNWDQILNANLSSRYVWGYSPNYLGMIAGSIALAVLAWMMFPVHGKVVRSAWFAGVPLLTFVSILIYTSQSRSGWVGLMAGLLALASLLIGSTSMSRRQIVILILLIALLGVPLFAFDGGAMLSERIKMEWDSISSVLSGDLQGAMNNSDSVGFRINMWIAGAKAFLEKPLLGWGPSSGALILRGEFTNVKFGHFHNLYVEILVSFGVVGALLVGFVGYHFLKPVVVAYRRRNLPDALVAGILVVTLQIATILIFNIRIGQTEGRAALMLLATYCAYALFQVTRLKSSFAGDPSVVSHIV
jgi:O-antigen ligase